MAFARRTTKRQRDHHFVLSKTLDSVRLVERIAALNKTRSAEFVLYQLITETKTIVNRKPEN